MTDRHCQCYHETKMRRRGGEDESEKEEECSEYVSYCVVLQCVNILLDYLGQRRFEYNDITVARKICTAVRMSLNNSQKQATIKKYFSK
jgi:hypothetical protein